jgi:hypothetical protein
MPIRHDSPGGSQVTFFEFLDDRGGADMQDARSVTNPAGIHCHVDDRLFHLSGVTGVGLSQQEGAPFACVFLTAVARLALTGCSMSDNISALAGGAAQDLANHDITRWRWGALTLIHPESIADQHLWNIAGPTGSEARIPVYLRAGAPGRHLGAPGRPSPFSNRIVCVVCVVLPPLLSDRRCAAHMLG